MTHYIVYMHVDAYTGPWKLSSSPWIMIEYEGVTGVTPENLRLVFRGMYAAHAKEKTPPIPCVMCKKDVIETHMEEAIHAWTAKDRSVITRVQGWAVETCSDELCKAKAKELIQPMFDAVKKLIEREGKFDTTSLKI